MHRTLGEDYIEVGGKRLYTDPNPPTVKGTVLPADAMNAIQEEIAKVIESAGIELAADGDTDTWDQLYKAIFESTALGSSALATSSVTEGKIAGSAVTTGKLANGSVTKEKAYNTNKTTVVDGVPSYGVGGVSRFGAASIPGELTPYMTESGIFTTNYFTDNIPDITELGSEYAGMKYTAGCIISSKELLENVVDMLGSDYRGNCILFIGYSYGSTHIATGTCFHVWTSTRFGEGSEAGGAWTLRYPSAAAAGSYGIANTYDSSTAGVVTLVNNSFKSVVLYTNSSAEGISRLDVKVVPGPVGSKTYCKAEFVIPASGHIELRFGHTGTSFHTVGSTVPESLSPDWGSAGDYGGLTPGKFFTVSGTVEWLAGNKAIVY